jgi:hypothetical protein
VLQHATSKELFPVYNKQQQMNYYLSTTNNKKELSLVYNEHEKRNYYLSTTRNKEKVLPVYNTQQRRNITCLQQTAKKK